MEACCGAHHLGRLLAAQGHEVRLMSPEYVRPYVKAQKNDDRDAEAIAEAATPADDAVRRSQNRGAARRPGSASRARPSRRPAYGTDEPDTQHPARAWDRRTAGSAQAARR